MNNRKMTQQSQSPYKYESHWQQFKTPKMQEREREWRGNKFSIKNTDKNWDKGRKSLQQDANHRKDYVINVSFN